MLLPGNRSYATCLQVHITEEWWSQDLNPGLAGPKVDLHPSSSLFLVSLEQLN